MLALLTGDDCVLEADPLATLASRGQLAAYEHDGFWQPMDTLRDRDELNRLWDSGEAPVDPRLTARGGALPDPAFWERPPRPADRPHGVQGLLAHVLAPCARRRGAWGSRCPSCRRDPSLWQQLALAGVDRRARRHHPR